MAIEKLVQAVTCIVRRRAVVFQPVTKQDRSRLEVRVKESMVRAGIDNELDWRPVIAPVGDLAGAFCRRRPIVEGSNEDERGYPRRRHRLPTWGLNAAAALSRKLPGGSNSSNPLVSAAKRVTQAPAGFQVDWTRQSKPRHFLPMTIA
jgi:hypothetical protein